MLMATTVQKEVRVNFPPLCHLHGFPNYLTIESLRRVAAVPSRAAAGCRLQFGHLAAVYRMPTLLSGVSGSRS